MKKHLLAFVWILTTVVAVHAETGYRLWLRYEPVRETALVNRYRKTINSIIVRTDSPTLTVASSELREGLNGLLSLEVPLVKNIRAGSVVLGKLSDPFIQKTAIATHSPLNQEGFIIQSTTIDKKKVILIAANEDVGILYGVFHFLRLIQSQASIENLRIESQPRINIRILNHWDNLDRTVERGYAGFSIWDWHTLPTHIDKRYRDYARANASIGINGTVLTNVNANAIALRTDYLEKVAALADVFRPYGIKVYLTARFSAPIELGGLPTSDPLDTRVQQWWKDKVNEIYKYVPDFGGFLVKANSEGQPGPQNYGRSHADGANMLADALKPHNGVVMWRAFVYDNEVPDDRAKQAYNEFKPLDGSFRDNIIVQVKNGAIDFQPREPFHPLFGAMPSTPLMMEFQITQEYLGFSTHLVYLAPLFKETLDAETHVRQAASKVSDVIDGSLHQYKYTGIAGVANIGNDMNWCGHPFAQANWYAFGRLAWDHTLSSKAIAEEWIRMTFTNDPAFIQPVLAMMETSRETAVSYMTPLGLHHIMGWSHHYGPAPWIDNKHRADWTSVYYHRANKNGIGFDRTISGSRAVDQYAPPLQSTFGSPETCPEIFLLWFHHLSWDFKTKSGRTLWNELVEKYYAGADSVAWMKQTWMTLEGKIDTERFEKIAMLLNIQHDEAIWWRDACVLYFQQFSERPIPAHLEKPTNSLNYYKNLSFPYAPGIRPEW